MKKLRKPLALTRETLAKLKISGGLVIDGDLSAKSCQATCNDPDNSCYPCRPPSSYKPFRCA